MPPSAKMPPVKVEFSMGQVFWQWALGMSVATPIIAIIQGSFMLNEFRVNHGHAPRPAMPARGVAVAVNTGTRPVLNTEKPLRLLVVGDSLAAGVGISKSGTPVLPESIARSLSKASGGRAVYWTCVGTPGVSASQIVQDIYQIDPHHPGRLEQLFSEWRIKRKKWQERKAVRRRLTELESTEDSDTDKPIRDFIVNWWETIRNAQKTSPKLIQETTKKAVDDWWSQVTSSFRRTRRSFEEDISDIKEIVQSDTTKDGAEATVEEDENTLVKKGNPFRRDFLDPVAACQFDIAVVLMGLNDIKDAFMPHMTAGRASSLEEGTVKIQGGLRRQLQEVLSALDTKMDLGGEEKDNSSTSDNGSLRNLRRPLVVVPELPVAPLSLFRTAPLCWFLVPIFRAMENNKRFLSSCFPEYVVFIPQPNLQWWSDVEAGLGPIRENARKERLLLRMTDIAQTARERIQGLMKEHYGAEDDDDTEMGSFDERPSDAEELQDLVDLEYSSKVERRKKGTKQQSPFIAADKMHPNDEGYEIWGRHIADAIIEHWNRE